MGQEGPAIGIDLGTTNCRVGIWLDEENRFELISTEPSYVAFTETERLIGDAAQEQVVRNPANTVFDAKRLIGRKFGDLGTDVHKMHIQWPFKVTRGKDDRPMVHVEYKGKEKAFSAMEVCSMLLAKLKDLAEVHSGSVVDMGCVSVPHCFTYVQRMAIRSACSLAGFEGVLLVNEPACAALAYTLQTGPSAKERKVVIFDLGGGSLDVTLLCIEEGLVEVKATSGDSQLGGEDFDLRLLDHFITEIREKYERDITRHSRVVRRLKKQVERVKLTLSTEPEASLQIESLLEDFTFYSTIKRACFEQMNADLFERMMSCVQDCLEGAGLDKKDVDEVILVGGSSRIPKVEELLAAFFYGSKVNTEMNRDEAVVFGAAARAGTLRHGYDALSNYLVLDAVPMSLGVETADGGVHVVYRRYGCVPGCSEQTFTTVHDDQVGVSIRVYEGEHPQARDNVLLATVELSGLAPAPRGMPQILVRFDVDSFGILSVSATDRTTGEKVVVHMDQEVEIDEDEERRRGLAVQVFLGGPSVPSEKPTSNPHEAFVVEEPSTTITSIPVLPEPVDDCVPGNTAESEDKPSTIITSHSGFSEPVDACVSEKTAESELEEIDSELPSESDTSKSKLEEISEPSPSFEGVESSSQEIPASESIGEAAETNSSPLSPPSESDDEMSEPPPTFAPGVESRSEEMSVPPPANESVKAVETTSPEEIREPNSPSSPALGSIKSMESRSEEFFESSPAFDSTNSMEFRSQEFFETSPAFESSRSLDPLELSDTWMGKHSLEFLEPSDTTEKHSLELLESSNTIEENAEEFPAPPHDAAIPSEFPAPPSPPPHRATIRASEFPAPPSPPPHEATIRASEFPAPPSPPPHRATIRASEFPAPPSPPPHEATIRASEFPAPPSPPPHEAAIRASEFPAPPSPPPHEAAIRASEFPPPSPPPHEAAIRASEFPAPPSPPPHEATIPSEIPAPPSPVGPTMALEFLEPQVSGPALVEEILELIHEVALLSDSRTHKRECGAFIRRVNMLVPLFEEVRDMGRPLSEETLTCFRSLEAALITAKDLLLLCSKGSRLWLVLEHRKVAEKFLSLNTALVQALNKLPDSLEISEEVQEQVDLVHNQLKRSKALEDAVDAQLNAELVSLLDETNDRSPDQLRSLAESFTLNTASALQKESDGLEGMAKEKALGLEIPEGLNQIAGLLSALRDLFPEDGSVESAPSRSSSSIELGESQEFSAQRSSNSIDAEPLENSQDAKIMAEESSAPLLNSSNSIEGDSQEFSAQRSSNSIDADSLERSQVDRDAKIVAPPSHSTNSGEGGPQECSPHCSSNSVDDRSVLEFEPRSPYRSSNSIDGRSSSQATAVGRNEMIKAMHVHSPRLEEHSAQPSYSSSNRSGEHSQNEKTSASPSHASTSFDAKSQEFPPQSPYSSSNSIDGRSSSQATAAGRNEMIKAMHVHSPRLEEHSAQPSYSSSNRSGEHSQNEKTSASPSHASTSFDAKSQEFPPQSPYSSSNSIDGRSSSQATAVGRNEMIKAMHVHSPRLEEHSAQPSYSSSNRSGEHSQNEKTSASPSHASTSFDAKSQEFPPQSPYSLSNSIDGRSSSQATAVGRNEMIKAMHVHSPRLEEHSAQPSYSSSNRSGEHSQNEKTSASPSHASTSFDAKSQEFPPQSPYSSSNSIDGRSSSQATAAGRNEMIKAMHVHSPRLEEHSAQPSYSSSNRSGEHSQNEKTSASPSHASTSFDAKSQEFPPQSPYSLSNSIDGRSSSQATAVGRNEMIKAMHVHSPRLEEHSAQPSYSSSNRSGEHSQNEKTSASPSHASTSFDAKSQEFPPQSPYSSSNSIDGRSSSQATAAGRNEMIKAMHVHSPRLEEHSAQPSYSSSNRSGEHSQNEKTSASPSHASTSFDAKSQEFPPQSPYSLSNSIDGRSSSQATAVGRNEMIKAMHVHSPRLEEHSAQPSYSSSNRSGEHSQNEKTSASPSHASTSFDAKSQEFPPRSPYSSSDSINGREDDTDERIKPQEHSAPPPPPPHRSSQEFPPRSPYSSSNSMNGREVNPDGRNKPQEHSAAAAAPPQSSNSRSQEFQRRSPYSSSNSMNEPQVKSFVSSEFSEQLPRHTPERSHEFPEYSSKPEFPEHSPSEKPWNGLEGTPREPAAAAAAAAAANKLTNSGTMPSPSHRSLASYSASSEASSGEFSGLLQEEQNAEAPHEGPGLRRATTGVDETHHLTKAETSRSASSPQLGSDSIIEDTVKKYTWNQVLSMTNNLSKTIGKGGFGAVYLGKLDSEKEVAVKILDANSQQGLTEFLNEVNLLKRVNHVYLVRLLGYCLETKQVLIYEYAEEGSIWDHLQVGAKPLDWKTRLKVALESACGLEYLHTGCHPRIIHRDIKSQNILLTKSMVAKVADFGLSKLGADQDNVSKTHVTTMVKGTLGYLDPEYLKTGQLTEKSDVYSFGVVLLEIVSGRKPIQNTDRRGFIGDWVEDLYNNNNNSSRHLKHVVDATLGSNYNSKAMKLVVNIAKDCILPHGMDRPEMTDVVHVLRKAQMTEHEKKPSKFFSFLS